MMFAAETLKMRKLKVFPAMLLAPLLACAPAKADETAKPLAEQGRVLYHSLTCVRCHGGDMVQNSSAAFDLRTFPKDDKARFVNSVTKGKNNRMPPWGDVLKPEEIEQLWAYVQTGGTK